MARTGLWIILAIIAVLIIAGILLIQKQGTNNGSNVGRGGQSGEGSSGNNGNTGETGENTGGSTGDTGTGEIPTPQTYNVEIKGFAFNPVTLRIKKGDTVIWTNKDSAKHSITSDSGNELDSELLSQGQTHSKTFDTAGTFEYHCIPHPYMKGKVIVE